MKSKLKLALLLLTFICAFIMGAMTVNATEETTELVYETTVSDSGNDSSELTYDPETKTLTIAYSGTKSWNELQPYSNTDKSYAVQNFIDQFRTEIKYVEIGKFGKIQIYSEGKLFYGMTALESVHFASAQRIVMNNSGNYGLFEGCTSLTTVWFGDDSNKIAGCANFTDFGANKDDNHKYFEEKLFKGCAALQSVILPTHEKINTIDSSTFAGCSALTSVTIPVTVTDIDITNFNDCPLTEMNYEEGSAAYLAALDMGLAPSLLSEKPTTTPLNEGYCYTNIKTTTTGSGSTLAVTSYTYDLTNVKWEVHNTGTEDAPEYTLYFFIDKNAPEGHVASKNISSVSNTLYTYANRAYITSGQCVSQGWRGNTGSWKYHMWNGDGTTAPTADKISKIVVGGGIETLSGGTVFAGMKGVTTIELPNSLKVMDDTDLKACNSLTTLYTRGIGGTPDVIDLSNFTTLPFDNQYSFDGLSSAKKYVWGDSLVVGTATKACAFNANNGLTSLTIPEGFTTISAELLYDCKNIKTITIPASVTTISANAFKNCPALEEIIILGDATLAAVEGAVNREDVLAVSTSNTFNNCPALKRITATPGTAASEFAYKYGFVDSLWAQKPTEGLVKEGYCINNSQAETNIKFEIYNVGTEDSPEYTMYFFIDETATDHVQTTAIVAGNATTGVTNTEYLGKTPNGWVQVGYRTGTNHYEYQAWYDASIDKTKITKVSIGDGITAIGYGNGVVFAGMTGLQVIEIPSTLVAMPYPSLKNCSALHTLYVRGTEAVEGTLDFSGFTTLPFASWYSFCGLRSVKQYKFPETTTATKISNVGFTDNDSLTSIVIPEGIATLSPETFLNCAVLESITLPSTVTAVSAQSFKTLPALKEVTFKSDVEIYYVEGAESKAEVIAENTANTFNNVPALEKIYASAGTKTFEFALKFGFATLADGKPTTDALHSGFVINGRKGCVLGDNPSTDAVETNYCTTAMEDHDVTNIKWEVFNVGTEETPEYVMYFSIDDDGYAAEYGTDGAYYGNTILYPYMYTNSGAHGYNWAESGKSGDCYKKHSWYVSGITEKIETIVIGDGITELNGGALVAMPALATLEMPTSLVKLNGVPLKSCVKLSKVYTRGQDPEDGTINLSNFTSISLGTGYVFTGLQSAKRYVFSDIFTYKGAIARTFLYNGSLEEIVLPEGITSLGYDTFSQCTSLKSLTVPSTVTKIENGSFINANALEEITFLGDTTIYYDSSATDKAGVIANNTSLNAFSRCSSLTTINAQFGTAAHTFALTFGFDTIHQLDDGDALLTFDPETGILTAVKSPQETATWYELDGTKASDSTIDIGDFFAAYKSKVKHLEIGSFSKIKENGYIFCDYPLLESIHFESTEQRISQSGKGIFKNCPKLTTIWFGKDKTDNTVDLGGIVFGTNSSTSTGFENGEIPANFTINLFTDCKAITSVILPDGYEYEVLTSTFAGCTSLSSIVIPENVTVADGAFDDCTAIRTILVKNPNIIDSADKIFPDIDGLYITTTSASVESAIETYYDNTKVIAIVNTVSAGGFSIRIEDYNGIRGIFSFDEAKNKELAAAGVALQEYGALVVSGAQYEALGGAYVGKISTGYTTNAAAVKKLPVYIKGGENSGYVGKILSSSTSDRIDFAATTVKFSNNFDSDLYMCAYSVYVDSFGYEYIEYANYGSINSKYELISLYDMTLDMFEADQLSGTVVGEKAVWNTLIQGAYEIGGTRETVLSGNASMMVVLDSEGADHLFVRALDKATAEGAVTAAEEIASSFTLANTFAIAVDDEANYSASYVTPAVAKTYVKRVGPTNVYNRAEHGAQHPQGMASDGEHLYISLTGIVLKIRISDGAEVGKFTASSALRSLGFHMGDMTYYNGKLYGGLSGWGTQKSYVGIINVDDIVGDVSDEVFYAAYLPESKAHASEYRLSNGDSKYAISGVDGTAVGTIPGKGYIDAEGNVHEDATKYLLMAFSGGVPTSSTDPDTVYDNDNYMIGAYSFDEVDAAAEPLTAERFVTDYVESKSVISEYRMFVYTGANRYGAQTMDVDKDTGDYIMNMYGRPHGSVYPANGAIVIDGAKMLYTDTIEVGQSVPSTSPDYEAAMAQAELYKDADGNYPTELFMTMKCHCALNDIDKHDAVAYGDSGYAFKFCSHYLTSYSNGYISLGNDYVYTLGSVSGSSDTNGWSVTITLRKFNHHIGKWSYSAVN